MALCVEPCASQVMSAEAGPTSDILTVAGACWRNGLVRKANLLTQEERVERRRRARKAPGRGDGNFTTMKERLDALHRRMDEVMALPVKYVKCTDQ